MSKPTEYLCQIDSGVLPTVDTTWSVQDSSLVNWTPQISTSGVVSNVSGGSTLNTPDAMGCNGHYWTWTVSTAGVLTMTSSGASLTSNDSVSALIDADSVIWLFSVGLDGQIRISTETPLENKQYYPAVIISFETSVATDTFELHAIKPNTTMHRR